jgi:hypothetical protein
MLHRRPLPASLCAFLLLGAYACNSSQNAPSANTPDSAVPDGESLLDSATLDSATGNADATAAADGGAGDVDGAPSLLDASSSSPGDASALDGDAGCPGGVTPTVLATGQAYPTSIVSDGANVYWINNSPSAGTIRSVMKVPVGGGTPVAIATNLRQPNYLAVDAVNAYWADAASTFPNGTILMSAPLDGSAALDGGAPTVLVASNIGLQQFVVAGGDIYYFNGSTLYVITTAGAAVKMLTPASTNASNATSDAANLYWTDNMKQVLALPFSGTTATVLTTLAGSADFLGATQPISVDATGVYVPANPGTGTDAVLQVPLAGGMPKTVATFASAFNGVPGIVSDGTNVYWANNFGFAVMRAPVTGGAAVAISCDQEKPQGIAQDTKNVYWTTEGGSIKALAK